MVDKILHGTEANSRTTGSVPYDAQGLSSNNPYPHQGIQNPPVFNNADHYPQNSSYNGQMSRNGSGTDLPPVYTPPEPNAIVSSGIYPRTTQPLQGTRKGKSLYVELIILPVLALTFVLGFITICFIMNNGQVPRVPETYERGGRFDKNEPKADEISRPWDGNLDNNPYKDLPDKSKLGKSYDREPSRDYGSISFSMSDDGSQSEDEEQDENFVVRAYNDVSQFIKRQLGI